MKSMKINNKQAKTFVLLPLILFSFFVTVSCNKEINKLSGIEGGHKGILVSVNGIRESNVGKANLDLTQRPIKSVKINGFNLDMSTKQGYGNINKNQRSGVNYSPMDDGIQYRILFYKTDTKEFAKDTLVTAGEIAEISIETGTAYDWYAYSYNNELDVAQPADLNNPIIPSKHDSDFLYAKGEITPTGSKDRIEISFDHKVTQVMVEIDAKQMHGDIADIKAVIEPSNYFNTGDFSLLENKYKTTTKYTPGELKFSEVTEGVNTVQAASVFTADATGMSEFKVNIQALTIKLINGVDFFAITSANSQTLAFSGFTVAPEGGGLIIGDMTFWKALKQKKILHLGNNLFDGLSGNAGAVRKTQDERKNFGLLSQSIVKIDGFEHRHEGIGGLPTFIKNFKPDIIIMSGFDLWPGQYSSLVQFINDGGVVFLYSDPELVGAPAYLNGLRSFFSTPGLEYVKGGNGGDAFPLLLLDNNDPIMNGPFGNVIGENWGSDGGPSHHITGLPKESIVVYSENGALNNNPVSGVTMFRHKTKGLFWVGDGGWTGNSKESGYKSENNRHPYASDGNYFPIKRPGYRDGYTPSNSIIFANALAWAATYAEYYGINYK